MSFSSDTGMAECLVVARKLKMNEPVAQKVDFISLSRRPRGFAPASAMATNLVRGDYVRNIEDGPYGGTRLTVGDELAGEMLSTPRGTDGEEWASVRLSDYSLAQTAYSLSRSQLKLPGNSCTYTLKVTALNTLSKLGLYHLDIIGAPPRGPYNKIAPNPTSTYPALWNHDAREETRMVCDPDSN